MSRDKIVKIVISSILAYFYTVPYYFTSAVGEGLDHSWKLALNLAISNSLIFGRDFIFTYGPLGFLSTRQIMGGIDPQLIFLFDILFFLCSAYTFYKCRDWIKSVGELILLMVILVMFRSTSDYGGVELGLTFLMLLNVVCYLEKKEKWDLIMASVLSTLVFFIKINYGIIDQIIIAVVICYCFLTRPRLKFFYSLILVGHIVGVIVLCRFLNVDLIEFVIWNFEIIRGYNHAMGTDAYLVEYSLIGYFFIIQIGLIAIWVCYSLLKYYRSVDFLFLTALLGLVFFVIYKNGFVRADLHLMTYFRSSSLIFITFYFVLGFQKVSRRIAFPFVIVLLSVPGIMLLKLHPTSYDLSYVSSSFSRVFLPSYFGQISFEKKDLPKDTTAFASKLGEHSVDIFPWDITTLYRQGLHYFGRPIPQSYSAYTEKLDRKNSVFFESDESPHYIFINNKTVDDRVAFWDESQTKLSLLSGYKILDTVKVLTTPNDAQQDLRILEDFAILEKRERKRGLELLELETFEISSKTPLDLNYDELVFARIIVKYNLLGKIRNILYKPPESFILIHIGDDVIKKRAILPIIEGGVLVSHYIGDISSLSRLFNLNIDDLPVITKIEFDISTRYTLENIQVELLKVVPSS